MKAVVAAFNQEKALVGAFSVITNLRIAFVWSTRGDPTTHCLPCPRLPGYSVWWQGQWPASQHRQPTIIRHHGRQHTSGDHSQAASEQWRWWCMITMMLVRWCNYHKDANDKVITVKMMRWWTDHNDADEMMNDHNDADKMMQWSKWCRLCSVADEMMRDHSDADCVESLMRWCVMAVMLRMQPATASLSGETKRHENETHPKTQEAWCVRGGGRSLCVCGQVLCRVHVTQYSVCGVYLVWGVIDSIMKSECSYLCLCLLTRTTQMCPP